MAVTSSVTIQTTFSGDVPANFINSALDNASSPGEVDVTTLIVGNNPITVPAVSGVVVTGLLIIPPPANTNLIKLKGVNGDTGINLHLTNPTFISIDPSESAFVLNNAGISSVVGLRLIWS